MVKIVFLDYDNTLYSHQTKSIPESAKKALKELQNKGIKVYISTGRTLTELQKLNVDSFDYDGIIALNGQVIYDKNNNVIKSTPLEKTVRDKIVEIFNNKIIPMAIVHIDELYVNYTTEKMIKIYNSVSSECPEISKLKDKDIYMGITVVEDDHTKEVLKEFEKIANIVYWSKDGLNIISKTASKAEGIKDVLKMYGFTKEEAVCFGDQQNDLSMFSAVGMSIAVGNGSDLIKENATHVTDDINNDGIAKAIYKYIN